MPPCESTAGEISIHAPLTGSDHTLGTHTQQGEFQSTLPLRGATRNIRRTIANKQISIHAPLTGSDFFPQCCAKWQTSFQSTLPLRGATVRNYGLDSTKPISIHAPLTGSDYCFLAAISTGTYFNPRSPYGERLAPSRIYRT